MTWANTVIHYGALVIAGGVGVTPLVLDEMIVRDYGYAPVFGPIGKLWLITIYTFVLGGILRLLAAYRQAVTRQESNRVIYVMIGTIIAAAGAFTDYFAALGLFLYPLGIQSNLIFAVLLTIAIVRHRLFDADLLVRQIFHYVMSTLALSGIIITSLLVISRSVESESLSIPIAVLVMLITGALFRPALSLERKIVEFITYRGRYGPMVRLRDLALELGQSLEGSTDKLAEVVRSIAPAMGCSQATLLAIDPEREDPTRVISEGRAVHLSVDSPIVRELRRREAPLHQRDLSDQLPSYDLGQRDRDFLKATKLDYRYITILYVFRHLFV